MIRANLRRYAKRVMRKSVQVSFETGPAPLRVQIAGFAIVALILAIVAIWNGFHTRELDKHGIRTNATVVANERAGDGSYPVFRFSDTLGRDHTVRAAASVGDYPVGSTIPVIYPEARPLKARVNDRIRLYTVTIITGTLSGAFLIGIAVMIRFRAIVQGMFATSLGKLRVSRRGTDGAVTKTEYSSSPLLTWVSRIFGAGAVLMVLAAAWTGWQSYESARTGVTARGTVVGLVRLGRRHELQVHFTDADGLSHRAVLPHLSNDYLIGDAIALIYPAGDPGEVRLRSLSASIGLPAYFTILAVLFFLVRFIARVQLAEIGSMRRPGIPKEDG